MNHPFDGKIVRGLKSAELAETIFDWVSCHGGMMSEAPKGFMEALFSVHRTNQQSFIGMIILILVEYGKFHKAHGENWHDERNADSVKLCIKLAELAEKGEIKTYMSFI